MGNMKYCILAALVLLAGCKARVDNVEANSVDAPAHIVVSDGGGAGSVFEVTLSDGTPCAVFVGSQKGGIDCGWGYRRKDKVEQ